MNDTEWYLLTADEEPVTDADGNQAAVDESEFGDDAQFELGYRLGKLDAEHPADASHFARDAESELKRRASA